jgi:hypothetical protein
MEQKIMWDDRKEEIRKLWQEGISGASIARQLGMTRNSVLGIVYRLRKLGFQLEERAAMKAPSEPKPKPVAKAAEPPRAKEVVAQIVWPERPKENISGVGILALRMSSCRYIVEDGDTETRKYCNEKKVRGSYCQKHYDICHVPIRIHSGKPVKMKF